LLAITGLCLALLVAGVIVVRTDWFKNRVRERIESVMTRATGGRVEIGGFTYNWRNLTAEVSRFVVHGTEPASAPPLFQADKIHIGLRVLSVLEKKVDVSSLVVDNPRVYITISPEGSTNIPRPTIPRFNQNVIEDLLDLHVQHIEIHHGVATYNTWRIPMDAVGEQLQMSLVYQPSGPRYLCAISSARMRVSSPKLRTPAAFSLDSQAELARNTIQVLRLNLVSGGMKIESKGSIVNLYSPQADFDVTAALPVAELDQILPSPLESRGDLWLQGRVTASGSSTDHFVGRVSGRSLGYIHKAIQIQNVALDSNADITPEKINLTDLRLSSPEGVFRGSAQVDDGKHMAMKGQVDGVTIAEVGRWAERNTGALAGTFSGPMQLEGEITPAGGLAGTVASAMLDLKPDQGGIPVTGSLAFDYTQRTGKLRLGDSQIHVGSTQASLSGTVGENVSLHVVTRNLNDALPVLHALRAPAPAQWPAELEGSEARVDALVTGALADPKISGKAEAGALKIGERRVDRFTSTFAVDRTSAVLDTLAIDQGKMRIEGNGRAELRNWKLEGGSPVSGALSLHNADVQTLAAAIGWSAPPANGSISASVRVSGSLESPLIAGNMTASDVTAYGERLGQARAAITLTNTSFEISNGEARNGSGRITLAARYNHPASDWQDGSVRFDVSATGVDLAQVKHLQDYESGFGGRLELNASGGAKIVNSRVDLTSLAGQLTVRNAAFAGHSYGNLTIVAGTKLPMLTVAATATLDNVQIHGTGEWRMEGDYSGSAHIPIPRISFATLHDLAPGKKLRQNLPFDGFIQGDAVVSGPLNQPSQMKADITLSAVQLNASPSVHPAAGVAPEDLVLRNSQPIHIIATPSAIDFGHASFVAKDTTLDASGRLLLHSNSNTTWDAALQGKINFSILQLFNPDLLGAGASILGVRVRGPLLDPQVEGRLELQNASLFIKGIPNGVDNANGLILFDSNRATVQHLTGNSGGGNISFESGSFLGFRGGALVYRLQASAQNVRYHSDSGFSVTADGALALVGTSDSSVLSGSVSLSRAAFNPTTDVGALLASTTTPVASTPNQYLKGLQLDVRVVTQHTLEVETALTRNIQADADLRVRGTPDHPVLLGHVTINSGQIEFFGNKYSINRGEVSFNNPARIEPILNMDLSTQVRGITVNVTFSGPLNKLNFSYRSDPPLEASDIIALLAVGRTPSVAGPLGTTPVTTSLNNGYLGTGGSDSLLSAAIAPNANRLQQFFGVSHIKIDPQLTDVTLVPQARLTMEQQVSSNVTLTYIQNLAISDQQIVRVEWDFNRKWSAVALRDENGAFSIDFVYRKRFR
jgi:translocation and assembly module TamB